MKNLLGIVLLSMFFLVQCNVSPTNPGDNLTNKDTANLGKVSFSLDLTNAPAEVVGLSGVLVDSKMDSVFFSFEIEGSSASALVENLIPGQWTLQVDAFNNQEIVIYTGTTQVNVQPGVTTPVHLNLNPTTGRLEITVSWGQDNTFALEFDGANDYLDIPDTLGLAGSSFTIEMWVKAYSWDNWYDYKRDAFIFLDLKGEIGAWVGLFKDEGTVGDKKFYFGTNDYEDGIYLYNTSDIFLKQWYHVACSFDVETNKKSIFVNGILENTAIHGPLSILSENNVVGNSAYFEHCLHGALDEIRIWNTLKTADEIQAKMYAHLEGNEPGLVLYYPLNDPYQQTVLDLTSDQKAILGTSSVTDSCDPLWIVADWMQL